MVLKKTGKMLSWLLSISMTLCMAPAMTLTAMADEVGYGVWIGETQITSENADYEEGRSWAYDPTSKVLRLSDFDFAGVGHFAEGFYSAIYSDHDLSIEFSGINEICETSAVGTAKSCGIYVDGSLTLYVNDATGKDVFYLETSKNAGNESVGIYLKKGTVDDERKSFIDSGRVMVNSQTGKGIIIDDYCSLTIRGAKTEFLTSSTLLPVIVSPSAQRFVIDGAKSVLVLSLNEETSGKAVTAVTLSGIYRAMTLSKEATQGEITQLDTGNEDQPAVYETGALNDHVIFIASGWTDLSGAAVRVDKANKKVTVKLDDDELNREKYELIFFSYEPLEYGEHLERVGTSFPTEPGTYIATISGIEEEGYLGGARSEPFTIEARSSGSSRSSGGGLPAVSPVTVPVTGEGSTVGVSASISGETATVQKPTDSQMEQLLGQSSDNGEILIDVSGLAKEVNTAVLPADTVKTISDVFNNADGAGFLTVGFTDGSISLDRDALTAMLEPAGDRVTLSLEKLDEKGRDSLTDAQKNALESFNPVAVYSVTANAGNAPVHDLKGGTETVTLKNVLQPGQKAEGLGGWYLAEDGSKEPVELSYRNGSTILQLNHNSVYVIDYDEERAANAVSLSEYKDLNESAWYAAGVGYVLEKGLMKGVEDGIFAPDGVITRAQMAQILHNLEGNPSYSGRIFFKDVDPEKWYAPAIRWANAEGLMEGYDESAFGTNDVLTREQLVTVLHRYGQYRQVVTRTDGDLSSFSDGAAVSPWAVDAFSWAVQSGIVDGVGGNALAPKESATRAQMAAILMRYCENVAK